MASRVTRCRGRSQDQQRVRLLAHATGLELSAGRAAAPAGAMLLLSARRMARRRLRARQLSRCSAERGEIVAVWVGLLGCVPPSRPENGTPGGAHPLRRSSSLGSTQRSGSDLLNPTVPVIELAPACAGRRRTPGCRHERGCPVSPRRKRARLPVSSRKVCPQAVSIRFVGINAEMVGLIGDRHAGVSQAFHCSRSCPQSCAAGDRPPDRSPTSHPTSWRSAPVRAGPLLQLASPRRAAAELCHWLRIEVSVAEDQEMVQPALIAAWRWNPSNAPEGFACPGACKHQQVASCMALELAACLPQQAESAVAATALVEPGVTLGLVRGLPRPGG